MENTPSSLPVSEMKQIFTIHYAAVIPLDAFTFDNLVVQSGRYSFILVKSVNRGGEDNLFLDLLALKS